MNQISNFFLGGRRPPNPPFNYIYVKVYLRCIITLNIVNFWGLILFGVDFATLHKVSVIGSRLIFKKLICGFIEGKGGSGRRSPPVAEGEKILRVNKPPLDKGNFDL